MLRFPGKSEDFDIWTNSEILFYMVFKGGSSSAVGSTPVERVLVSSSTETVVLFEVGKKNKGKG